MAWNVTTINGLVYTMSTMKSRNVDIEKKVMYNLKILVYYDFTTLMHHSTRIELRITTITKMYCLPTISFVSFADTWIKRSKFKKTP